MQDTDKAKLRNRQRNAGAIEFTSPSGYDNLYEEQIEELSSGRRFRLRR